MVMGFALQAQQEYIELGSIISRGGSSLVSSNERVMRDGISILRKALHKMLRLYDCFLTLTAGDKW